MNQSDDKHLYVNWAEYHDLIEQLALKVHQSGWGFDMILCLARGGVRVGDELSRIYDVPLAILSTSSYRAEAGTVQDVLDIGKHITVSKGEFGGRVLLVDDLVDSGHTLLEVQQHLQKQYPAVTEVKNAVIWWKACSKITPDYYVSHLPTNPWIHQPFEEYDTLRPAQLSAWMGRGQV